MRQTHSWSGLKPSERSQSPSRDGGGSSGDWKHLLSSRAHPRHLNTAPSKSLSSQPPLRILLSQTFSCFFGRGGWHRTAEDKPTCIFHPQQPRGQTATRVSGRHLPSGGRRKEPRYPGRRRPQAGAEPRGAHAARDGGGGLALPAHTLLLLLSPVGCQDIQLREGGRERTDGFSTLKNSSEAHLVPAAPGAAPQAPPAPGRCRSRGCGHSEHPVPATRTQPSCPSETGMLPQGIPGGAACQRSELFTLTAGKHFFLVLLSEQVNAPARRRSV